MSSTLTRTDPVEIESLLIEIPGNPPTGESLKYSLLIDQIKEARREDNAQLSQGIWEAPLKKADWPLVESLCLDTLVNKSKDLQCTGWLTEAWTALDNLPGLIKGLKLLNQLCEKFWPDLYPEINDNDMEYRLHVFDWLDESLSEMTLNIPLFTTTTTQEEITLADWIAAKRLDNILRRSTEPKKILKKAEEEKQLTLSSFNQHASVTPREIFVSFSDHIAEAINSLKDLKSTLDTYCQKQAPSLNTLSERLLEMQRAINLALSKAQPNLMRTKPAPDNELEGASDTSFEYDTLITPTQEPPQASPPLPPQQLTRDSAYQQIAQIAEFLQKIEPHSPVPQVLNRLVSWKNKNISEIFAEFSDNSNDLVAITRLFSK